MTDIATAGKLDTLNDRITMVLAELHSITLLIGCAVLAVTQGDATRAEAAAGALADVMARSFAAARQAEAHLAKLADVRRHTEATEVGKALRDAGAGGASAATLASSLEGFRASLELAKQLAAPWLADAMGRARAWPLDIESARDLAGAWVDAKGSEVQLVDADREGLLAWVRHAHGQGLDAGTVGAALRVETEVAAELLALVTAERGS